MPWPDDDLPACVEDRSHDWARAGKALARCRRCDLERPAVCFEAGFVVDTGGQQGFLVVEPGWAHPEAGSYKELAGRARELRLRTGKGPGKSWQSKKAEHRKLKALADDRYLWVAGVRSIFDLCRRIGADQNYIEARNAPRGTEIRVRTARLIRAARALAVLSTARFDMDRSAVDQLVSRGSSGLHEVWQEIRAARVGEALRTMG